MVVCLLLAARWESEVAAASALTLALRSFLRDCRRGFLDDRSAASAYRNARILRRHPTPSVYAFRNLLIGFVVLIYIALAAYVGVSAFMRSTPDAGINRLWLWVCLWSVPIGFGAAALIVEASLKHGKATTNSTSLLHAWALQSRWIVLMMAIAPLAVLSMFIVARTLVHQPLVGADPASWFRRVGFEVSYGVPLVLVAAHVHRLRDSRPIERLGIRSWAAVQRGGDDDRAGAHRPRRWSVGRQSLDHSRTGERHRFKHRRTNLAGKYRRASQENADGRGRRDRPKARRCASSKSQAAESVGRSFCALAAVARIASAGGGDSGRCVSCPCYGALGDGVVAPWRDVELGVGRRWASGMVGARVVGCRGGLAFVGTTNRADARRDICGGAGEYRRSHGVAAVGRSRTSVPCADGRFVPGGVVTACWVRGR